MGIFNKRKSNDSGAAMLVVTCVMAVISILCLSILLAAYQMYATVSDEGADETYYRQAISFSEVLKDRLVKDRNLPGNKLEEDSVEEFIYTYMYDDENYTYDDTDGESIKATSVSGTHKDDYGTINITLNKQSVTTDDKKNSWSDSKESYLIVTVDVLKGDEIKATSTMKFDYYYATENYVYYYVDKSGDQIPLNIDSNDPNRLIIKWTEPDPNDPSKLITKETSVSLSTLKSNLGEVNVGGEDITVIRKAMADDNGFRLGFMGYY